MSFFVSCIPLCVLINFSCVLLIYGMFVNCCEFTRDSKDSTCIHLVGNVWTWSCVIFLPVRAFKTKLQTSVVIKYNECYVWYGCSPSVFCTYALFCLKHDRVQRPCYCNWKKNLYSSFCFILSKSTVFWCGKWRTSLNF